jgi:hypothetical protein
MVDLCTVTLTGSQIIGPWESAVIRVIEDHQAFGSHNAKYTGDHRLYFQSYMPS